MNGVRTTRHPWVGGLLIAAGLLGVVTGLVPLTVNALRIVADEKLWGAVELAAHGVEALGLSLDWALLSSAAGAGLGVLLLCAGLGWRRGVPWAAPVSWAYVVMGLAVNATDLLIFALRARPGPTRTTMLLADGVAVLIPLALAAWMIRQKASPWPPGGPHSPIDN